MGLNMLKARICYGDPFVPFVISIFYFKIHEPIASSSKISSRVTNAYKMQFSFMEQYV
jgi:hypothetical protein